MISSLRRRFALCILLCIPAVPALADIADGPARLVADLVPGSESRATLLGGFASVGDKAVFLRNDNEYEAALWATDGTPEGTSTLAVLSLPGAYSILLGSTGTVAFYQIGESGPSPRMQIWRTDGTRAGTFPVMFGIGSPLPAAINGGRLFFAACTPGQGCEVWSSDGTVAGTGLAGEIVPGPGSADIRQIAAAGDRAFVLTGSALWSAGPSGAELLLETPKIRRLAADGGRAFFLAEHARTGGFEVWTSDGTAAGTRPVTHFAAQNAFGRYPFATLVAGRFYFMARHGKGPQLWSVAAAPETLRRLTDFSSPDTYVSTIRKAGSRILFVAQVPSSERRLWASSGDFRSTAPVSGCAGGCPLAESDLAPLGQGRFVFKGSNAAGEALWVTDGTGPGTRLLQPTGRYHDLTQFVSLGDRVLVELTNEYETGELWLTDGTAAGTFFVSHGGPSWSHYWGWGGPLLAARASHRLVFPILADPEEDPYGTVVSSDGSPGGLLEITRFEVGKSSYPQQLVPLRDRLLVQTCTGPTLELLAVRGTEATPLLSRPFDSSCGGYALTPRIVAQDDRAVFLLYDPTYETGLWGTDGTPAGTVPLIATGPDLLVPDVVPFGDRFAAWVIVSDGPGLSRSQLWVTDGTPAGTGKLLDLPVVTGMYGLTASGGRLYFFDAEPDGRGGFRTRPWVSDGTTAGTHPLSGVNGTWAGHGFTEAAGRLFFRFIPESGPNAGTTEIWSTDGTPAGTGPAITADSGARGPQGLYGAGGRLYFAARRAPGGPLVPWVSDGTGAGTAPLADAALQEIPDYVVVPPRHFTELGDRVYFAASDMAHGDELWSTDGTPEGTALVKDIAPGKLDAEPRSLVAWRGRLYFRARDIAHGMELWTSDGTAEGTRLVQDISPGPSWSNPQELTVAGESLYFSAHDGEHGRELWELPEEP